jgi:serine-type D-Ala-D-Ala carboxypeptidase/endopeptidase (penicillin-binding protein 4)
MACATALVAFGLAACHVSARPASPARPAPPALAARAALVRDIDAILADPVLAHGYWGVFVKSLKTDDALYDLNSRKLLIPASNMKIVTLAAAAERLGWDYSYETQLLAAGRIEAGRLDGDLLVLGSGDPSLMDADADMAFGGWADRLQAMGVRTVSGRLVGDDNAFDNEGLGFGWSWDDLPDDYAAGVSALQFNENAVRLTVTPGGAVGDYAGVSIVPVGSGLTVDSALRTSAAGTPPSITAQRLPGSARLTLRGSVPAGGAPASRVVSVDNPTIFFVNALRRALIARGIDVRGPAVDIDDVGDPPSKDRATLVAAHRSPPLSVLAVRLMKVSQNLYAETLLKTIGSTAGTATFAAGRTNAQATLQAWGVGAGDLIERDGSGLSRYDFVTPAALVAILTHVNHDETLRAPFEQALPIAGRDGTLANRMKGTPAEGNARAKTGSMSNVRALSGYVTSAGGEPLVFSIIANNFETAPETITRATDAIVVKLAEFRR